MSPVWPTATSKYLKKHGRAPACFKNWSNILWTDPWGPNTEAELTVHTFFANYWSLRWKEFRFIFGYIFYGYMAPNITCHWTKLLVRPFTCVICNPSANNLSLSTHLVHCSPRIKWGTLKCLFSVKLKLDYWESLCCWVFFVFNKTL